MADPECKNCLGDGWYLQRLFHGAISPNVAGACEDCNPYGDAPDYLGWITKRDRAFKQLCKAKEEGAVDLPEDLD